MKFGSPVIAFIGRTARKFRPDPSASGSYELTANEGAELHVLFIHPYFPGQFEKLATALRNTHGFQVSAIGRGARTPSRLGHVNRFQEDAPRSRPGMQALKKFEQHLLRGSKVAELLEKISRSNHIPDVIIAHPGWGDAMFVKDIFPQTPILSYMEYYYRKKNSDIDFDPEMSRDMPDSTSLRLANLPSLMSFEHASACVTPTRWQASLFPPLISGQLNVLHDGIDTDRLRPDPYVIVELPCGKQLSRENEVVTFVSRSLEPYRGFHSFMRALPSILETRPKAEVIIVGDESPFYGPPPSESRSWKENLLKEVGKHLDMSRVHFVGILPYDQYVKVLQISKVHIYLTYPFVLSWSLLEAMACGCAVVASSTGPVLEIIDDGVDGILVDFFKAEELVESVDRVLRYPSLGKLLGTHARTKMISEFDFKVVIFEKYRKLLVDIC